MSKGENSQKDELYKSLKDSATTYGSAFFPYLIFVGYPAFIILSVTDVHLFLDSDLIEPVLGMKFRTSYVFMIVPWVFVLLHFNLLVHMSVLSRKLDAYREYVGKHSQPLMLPDVLILQCADESRSQSFRIMIGGVFIYGVLIWLPIITLCSIFRESYPLENEVLFFQILAFVIDISLIIFFYPDMKKMYKPKSAFVSKLYFEFGGVMHILTVIAFLLLLNFTFYTVGNPATSYKISTILDASLDVSLDVSNERLNLDSDKIKLFSHKLINSNKEEQHSINSDICEIDRTLVVDLKNRSYKGANLEGAILCNLDLSSANLEEANFRGVELYGVTLNGANLQGADLRDAELQGADLRDAELQGADLRFAELQGADLRGAELQGADLFRAELQGANLWEAQLQGADLRGAELQGADLFRAELQGADLRGAELQGADLFRAQLQGADLRFAELQGADLRGAQLQGAVLSNAQLQGANLSDAQLQGVFSSIHIDSQRKLESAFEKGHLTFFKTLITLRTDQPRDLLGISTVTITNMAGYIQEITSKMGEYVPEHRVNGFIDQMEASQGVDVIANIKNQSDQDTTYTKEEAEQWIQEFKNALCKIPEDLYEKRYGEKLDCP